MSSWALKLAQAAGLRAILTSSSDDKLRKMQEIYQQPPLQTINYRTTPNWHEQVLELTDGVGADLIIDNGGTSTLVKSLMCARRGGIVSQVGYLGKQDPQDLSELVATIIDRRVNLRYVAALLSGSIIHQLIQLSGINAGSKLDLDDLCAAIEATQIDLTDLIDTVYDFDKSEEALQALWEGKVVGKSVIRIG